MTQVSYCLNTSTIQPAALPEKIRLAGKYGFASVELWLADLELWLAEGKTLKELRTLLSDQGLQVASVIALKGWAEASEPEWTELRAKIQRNMDTAAELGSPFIVATPPREPLPLHTVSRRYRELLALGHHAGVRPAMEYLGFSRSVWRVDQALGIAQEAVNPGAAIVLDTFHTYRGGSSSAELERVPGDRIAVYHVNDAPAFPPRPEQSDADRVMLGDGCLDLVGQLSLACQAGYSGAVSLELFNRELWSRDPEMVVGLGMERLRELLDRVTAACYTGPING